MNELKYFDLNELAEIVEWANQQRFEGTPNKKGFLIVHTDTEHYHVKLSNFNVFDQGDKQWRISLITHEDRRAMSERMERERAIRARMDKRSLEINIFSKNKAGDPTVNL